MVIKFEATCICERLTLLHRADAKSFQGVCH